jgi:[protein-PII] uridylyltransferase
MFSTATQVNLSLDTRNDRTILELIAADRPGLLSEVGKVFKAERIDLNGARIMTVGERAEDVFYLTDKDGHPLHVDACKRLQQALTLALDRRETAKL